MLLSQHSGALEAAAASRHSRGPTPQMRLPDGKSDDPANPPSYTILTSLNPCLLNSKENIPLHALFPVLPFQLSFCGMLLFSSV